MRRLRKERAGVGASVPAFQSQLHRYLPKSCSVPPPCIGLIVSELLSSRRVHSQRNAEEKKQLQDAPGCRKIELWRFAAMGMTLDVSSRRACSQRCSCRDGGGCSSPSCIQSVRRAAVRLPCVSQCEMRGRPIRQRRPRVLMLASLQTLQAHFRKKGKKHIPEESWAELRLSVTEHPFERGGRLNSHGGGQPSGGSGHRGVQ